MVINLHDFKGQLEISNCTITNNSVFIPSAIFANLNSVGSDSISLDTEKNKQILIFTQQFVSYQIKGVHHFYWLNHLTVEKMELMHGFQTESTLMIRDMDGAIVVSNSTFEGNIGLHGGAMHVS